MKIIHIARPDNYFTVSTLYRILFNIFYNNSKELFTLLFIYNGYL